MTLRDEIWEHYDHTLNLIAFHEWLEARITVEVTEAQLNEAGWWVEVVATDGTQAHCKYLRYALDAARQRLAELEGKR